MRLSVAILFTPEIVTELSGAVDTLRHAASSGIFTSPENLHLTLSFIGETIRASDILAIMRMTAPKPFTIELSECGRTRRASGDIFWASLSENKALADYADDLVSELRKSKFKIYSDKFVPRITLGREVELNGNISIPMKKLSMECKRVSLLKSESVGKDIEYTETDGIDFNTK